MIAQIEAVKQCIYSWPCVGLIDLSKRQQFESSVYEENGHWLYYLVLFPIESNYTKFMNY